MRIFRAIALFVVTFLALDSMLGTVIEARGASDYIEEFHSWNMFLCSVVSVVILELAFLSIKGLRRFPWFMQWLVYIHLVLLLAFLMLPLADWIAVQNERAQGPPILEDAGYGWYYWDDSGMGGNPINGTYLIFFPFQPVYFGAFLFGSGAIFGLSSGAWFFKKAGGIQDRAA